MADLVPLPASIGGLPEYSPGRLLRITVRLPSGRQIHQVGRPSVQQVNVTLNHTPAPQVARAGQAPNDD
ncbi:MAG: hypothetical protein F4Y08_06200 [Caldilineaceae bacterium SB0662_bin_9]|uniref:Uncharacterized protein n=1 Tax=Caldilineaceae bacterium SB0662_bin_9 TaxID=2605258 RepID=A0A6B1DRK7_9CHLR|nr:hypothetical protein [Caldilineaceae bacterium SB0662_bin_9]